MAAAGFGPDQVDRWLPYQLVAAYKGYVAANTLPDDTPAPPSDDEFRAVVESRMR